MVNLSIFLLGTLLVFFISLLMSRPLTKLVNMNKQVPGGDLSGGVPFPLSRVKGTLATSFNVVLKNLQTRASQLQTNVKEQKSLREALKQVEVEKRILEEQLRHSQKMETIGKQAGGIVHDFNNILSVIIGYTDMTIAMVPEGSAEEKNLKRVMAASLQARDMAKRILESNRKGDNEQKPLWLNKEVRETLKLIRATTPATIELRENIMNSSSQVMADKYDIQQILMNLCSNANHAMKEKGGVLTISLSEVWMKPDAIKGIDLKTDYYQHLTVSDTGHGIDPRIIRRIFEPYFTTKGENGGVGMGLDLVHRIVKKYGGDITVYSKPGKGTTFHIFLPGLPGVGQEENKHNAAVGLPENGLAQSMVSVSPAKEKMKA